MSNSVSIQGASGVEATRRRLSERQAETVDRVLDAALHMLRTDGYGALTVRGVASAAGVAPATAYNYFTSREHLVTEVFWRLLSASQPARLDGRLGAARRVTATLRDVTDLVVAEPELAAACTAAMLADDADVKVLRDRIGADLRRRLLMALGGETREGDGTADPAVIGVLELAISGALLQAGMGHLDYSELPGRLATVVDLVVGRGRHLGGTQ
ncbi:MAG: TetR/AcrR family transcriptional regulator [Microthrixaceae bacterium]